MVEEANPKVKEAPSRKRGKMSDEAKAKRQETRRRNEEAKAAEERQRVEEAVARASDGDFLQGHAPDEGLPWEGHFKDEPYVPQLDVKTGLDRNERETIDLALKLDQVETRIKEAAIPKDTRKMILQEIQVDSMNKIRRYVELTPSMCDVRGCGFDAAKEAGATDWNNAPVNQPMPNGKTIGERLIALKEYHKATAHTNASLNDHIITADEMNKRQWGIGQDIRGEFLTGSR